MSSLSSASKHMLSLEIINLVIQQSYKIQPLSSDARLITPQVRSEPRKMFKQKTKLGRHLQKIK